MEVNPTIKLGQSWARITVARGNTGVKGKLSLTLPFISVAETARINAVILLMQT